MYFSGPGRKWIPDFMQILIVSDFSPRAAGNPFIARLRDKPDTFK
jgi:hypothetical protein